jgi:hypothetical protein
METKHPRFGHATGVLLTLAGLISLWVYESATHDLQAFLTIDILFTFLLPFILMNEGYNMHRKVFFSQSCNSFFFGVVIVILNWGINSYAFWIMFENVETKNWVSNWNILETSVDKWEYRNFNLNFDQIMVLAAVVSSIDLLAVLHRSQILHTLTCTILF